MALKKKPVTGMKDILPAEMRIRSYVLGVIRDTYKSFGFSEIETPCVEHIENLLSKQGGDNEKLIFKILKRGAKLDIAAAGDENDLVDCGLRYDLTLPLTRYYANNAAALPTPFKALQIGNVWRADRPQKGRFRQFMQCDIDILGDASSMAEIELITATATALRRICPDRDFTVRVNDRRLLRAMAEYSGFPREEAEKVFITIDKMDKIGAEGVKEELIGLGYPGEAAERCLGLMTGVTKPGGKDNEAASDEITGAGERNGAAETAGPNEARQMGRILGGFLEADAAENLARIMETAGEVADGVKIVFDPTLVRGMGYYTGTIFEVSMEGLGVSVAGGGRYDGMVGKFTGMETPACGFSIGFERIVSILMDAGFTVPESGGAMQAWLIEKGLPAGDMAQIMREAMEERAAGGAILVAQMNKNRKFQKEQLKKEGYGEIREFFVRKDGK